MKDQIASGARRHAVTLSTLGPPVANGDGGFTQAPIALVPSPVYAAIRTPTARDLERLAAGTVLSTQTLLVTLPFHPGVTTTTRLAWTDPAGRAHVANVTGVNNPDQRCIDLELVAVEVVD
jgi:head-tail adaptor